MMRTFAPLFALVLGTSASALAQAPEFSSETIGQLGHVIRWSGVVTSVFVIAGAYFLLQLVHGLVLRLGTQFAERRLTFQKFETFFQFFVYVGTLSLVVVLSLRLDDNVLAVVGGTTAVSLGFAVKDLVASFIAGIMIMLDRPFQVGDRVDFGGQYGDITAIGLRSVRMQTLDDNTVTIPNNKFINDITSCGNYGALDMQVTMDFYVGLQEDIDRARDILHDAAMSSRYVHLPKPIQVQVKQLITDNYIAVRLRLKAYVLDTRYEKAFETDVNVRAMRAFREDNVMPPALLHRNTGS